MPTSVHIPGPLLEAIDRRARALKISRNKLIIQALKHEVTGGADWPAAFWQELEHADPELVQAVEDMSRSIQANRRSKGPTKL
jgi:hypothetical protein